MSAFKLHTGDELYYEDHGSGSNTIVMVHGWTSSHDMYVKPVEILEKYMRCIIYDQRGHGLSTSNEDKMICLDTLAEDLKELIDGLQLENICLLGWSMGAMVVMQYINNYGCKGLKKIILCDMSPKVVNDEGWEYGMNKLKYIPNKNVKFDKAQVFSLYKKFVLKTDPSLNNRSCDEVNSYIKKKVSSITPGVLKYLSKSMKEADNRAVISKIDVPFCYFYADPGSIFLPQLSEWYRQQAHTEYEAISFKGSHRFIREHPDEFAQEVIRQVV